MPNLEPRKSWRGTATLLKEARELTGLSRKAAGDAIGISRQAIWEIECRDRPTKGEELFKLADLYGVSPEWLLERGKSKPRDDRAEFAAQILAGLTDGQLNLLLQAIELVKRERPRSLNFPGA